MTTAVQSAQPDLLEFLKSLCRYYSDFLETDFHASRLPSRQLVTRTKDNYLSLLPLSEFPNFEKAVHRALLHRFETGPLPVITRPKAPDEQPALAGVSDGQSLYHGVFELFRNLQLLDKHAAYLYFCPLTFDGHRYPLFFVPVTIEPNESHDQFTVDPVPVLYINQRAIQYVTQQLAERGSPRWTPGIPHRQIYLSSFSDLEIQTELQRILNEICDYGSCGKVSLGNLGAATTAPAFSIEMNVFLAIAPQGDEALTTDYEHLLMLLQTDPQNPSLLGMFRVLQEYLFENPESFETIVEQELRDEEMTARLNYPSPIPLNREQLAITRALAKPNCRRVVVEGPPGTGKSHTITGLIFNALQTGRSVLLVSDKKEALDVVEDKINQVLNTVAVDDSFQNPILRLGSKDTNLAKIFYEGNLQKIRARQRALEHRESAYTSDVARIQSSIAQQAEQSVDATIALHSQLAVDTLGFEYQHQTLIEALDPTETGTDKKAAFIHLWSAANRFRSALGALEPIQWLEHPHSLEQFIGELSACRNAASTLAALAKNAPHRFLRDIREDNLPVLFILPQRVLALRRPVIGFLFARRQLATLALEMRQYFPNCDLTNWNGVIAETPAEAAVYTQAMELAPRMTILEIDPLIELRNNSASRLADMLTELIDAARDLKSAIASLPRTASAMGIQPDDARSVRSSELVRLSEADIRALETYWHGLAELEAVSVHLSGGRYLSDRAEIENRLTLQMSSILDKSVLQFSETHKNDAQELRKFVRGRKQIPRSLLSGLVEAFPCIIVGIRELGAYIPFEHEIFDLAIIDEASQVSIAQALPAILRAKQTVVLGDPKQYSNVKSAYASREINAAAFSRVREALSAALHDRSDDDKRRYREKVQNFNVKSSILDFIRNVANYKGLLRKHFRSYIELINYSNETFYKMLQVMKIRAKPIADVIQFAKVEPEPPPADDTNTNTVEADHILEEIKKLEDSGFNGTIGIITPFTDQQRYIAGRVFDSPSFSDWKSKFRIKVMTFDTCQGEERDIIFYSMVERLDQDKLRFIFPINLANRSIEDEGDIKAQRLNVGFSRAKERVHFTLSKPVESFTGEAGTALRSFQSQLTKPDFASLLERTDPKSAMEKPVLQYIWQTSFYKENADRIDIVPQFPIGEMLRQLDPYARVPRYTADFLIMFTAEDGSNTKVVVEYEGAEHHYGDPDFLNEFTYDRLRATDDVERMRIIESYGYPIIVLNKFLLRRDPIATIDRLLRTALKKKSFDFQERIGDLLAKYAPNETRQCSQCKATRKIESFFDARLKSGVGKICSVCSPRRGLDPNASYESIPEEKPSPYSESVQRAMRMFGPSEYTRRPESPDTHLFPSAELILSQTKAAIELLGDNAEPQAIRAEVKTQIFGGKPLNAVTQTDLNRHIDHVLRSLKLRPNGSRTLEPRSVRAATRSIAGTADNFSCPKCGGQMVMRKGQYGQFLGCRQFPQCRGTRRT